MPAPLVAFLPDADPQQPGVLTGGNFFVPTERGLGPAPSKVATGQGALAAACLGAATIVKLDGSVRFFAGTGTKLYEGASASWTDRTRASGGDYTAGKWRFAQFGNVSLAAQKGDVLQASSSGAFADVSGSPKASIVETVGQFVMLANTDDGGSYGDRPDSWWCSALGDYTDWTPAIATQCATGRLTSVPGVITALRRFGDGIFVGKERGCYIGTYTGAPFIWSFQEIPSDSGPVSQEACIVIGTPEQPKLFYVARDNFYMFDGARPQPVGDGVKNYFLSRVNASQFGAVQCVHDRKRSLVYVYYPTGNATTPTAALVWHYRSGRWGVADRSIEAVSEYIGTSITYDSLPSVTYDEIPAVPYDDLYATRAAIGDATVFDTTHTPYSLTGGAEASLLITGDYGDNRRYSLVKRLKPLWVVEPTSATIQPYYRKNSGTTLLQGPQASMYCARFDFLQTGRWHRFAVQTQGPWEMSRFDVDLQPQGLE